MAAYDSPITSPNRSRYMPCKVYMLDDTILTFDILPKSLGKVLFDAVVSKLQLLEADYFGLEFIDTDNVPCWLDHEKPICKQVCTQDINFHFLVKFYTPDPELLEEELSRYLFALQVKKDLASGTLFCQEHTAVLLASFVVQAEVGNYCDELAEQNYMAGLKLLPNQNAEIEYKIMEHHREHIGQSPAEADFNLLDTARKVEVYGIRMYPVKDHDGICLQLSVMHAGIVVFQNYTKINSFSWAKIRKLCFKRKKFIIKLHADGSAYSKDTVEFYCTSRNASKNFWKRCIEYHSFFRCHSTQSEARRHRSRSRVVSRGSSFRYSGRTQKELVEFVRDNYVSPTPFVRSASMRTMSALNSRASTPRSGTLSSHRDLRFGGSGIVGSYSMATGSRTLERSCPGSFDRSSLDRSDRSRYMTRGGSFERSCPGTFDRHHGSSADEYELRQPSWHSFVPFHRGNGTVESGMGAAEQAAAGDCNGDGLPAQMHKIDPSRFMLNRESSFGEHLPQPPASTMRSLQLSLRDEQSLPRSPEFVANQQSGPNSLQRQDPLASVYGRPPIAPGHQFCRQDRFDVTPNSSQEQPSPPVPPSTRSGLSDGSGDEFQRYRFSRVQRNDTNATATSKSTASTASFTLTSNASIMSSQTDDSEDESKRKRFANDNAYYVVKELLMTERTYKKDLEVIAVWFQDAVSRVDVMPDYLNDLLFNTIVPIYEFHCGLLKEIDHRVAVWEGKSTILRNGNDGRRIGDVLLSNMTVLQWYRNHLDRHEEIMEQLEVAASRNHDIQRVIDEFESQKVCYLPLHVFFLRPFQRLIQYRLFLNKLIHFYPADHLDLKDCKACLDAVTSVTELYQGKLKHIQNWQKLYEQQKDICGLDNIMQNNRLFIREGCLQKLSHKGFQPRMFFLFSDILVYASRVTTPKVQFKVHGQMSLGSLTVVEEADTDLLLSAPYCFSIYSGNRSLVLAASSQQEKDMWLADLEMAVRSAKCKIDGNATHVLYPSLKSNSSSEALDDPECDESIFHSPLLGRHTNALQQRQNSISHICWHRSTTVSSTDYLIALQNHLSGYLLRKFKSSNGWQKLWVVVNNFTLFFYKNFQDDFPLASLPLLGYTVGIPTETDGIHKDLVLKLQFRNHIYFFRTDSEYAFQRWLEVIRSATCVSCPPDYGQDIIGDMTHTV